MARGERKARLPRRLRLALARWNRGPAHSLRLRMLLQLVLPLALLQLGLIAADYGQLRQAELQELQREQRVLSTQVAARLAATLRADPALLQRKADLAAVLQEAAVDPGWLVLLAPGGELLASDERLPVLRSPLMRQLALAHGAWRQVPAGALTAQPLWLLQMPLPGTAPTLVSLIPEPVVLAPLQRRLHRLLWSLGGTTALAVLLLVLASDGATRPLRRLVSLTDRVAAGDLEGRIAGPFAAHELGRVQALFNRMLWRLQGSLARERQERLERDRLERDLELARRIQRTLLPAVLPCDPRLELAARCLAARTVAGDFYDVHWLDADTLAVAIADVAGKGMPAALFMAATCGALRSLGRPDQGPAATLQALNSTLAEGNGECLFLTLALLHWHLPSGRVVLANAGHPPPFLMRADGECLELGPPTGPLLAAFTGARYGELQAQLSPGDTLVLFTDGVSEPADASGVAFGEERLQRLLAEQGDAPAEEVCDAITNAVLRHGGRQLQDDLTLVVLRAPAG